jgi:hypothetical protein
VVKVPRQAATLLLVDTEVVAAVTTAQHDGTVTGVIVRPTDVAPEPHWVCQVLEPIGGDPEI